MLKTIFNLLIAVIIIESNLCIARDYSGGAIIVPIVDGLPSSSFNLKTDAASIFLEKAVLYKHNGWFTEDKEIAITAKMGINSRKKDSSATTLTITRVYKFDVSIYNDGRIEIPLKSLPLLDAFNLSGSNYLVTSIVMELFISKKRQKNDFSKTLETVIDVSKKIPVPINPYAEYANVFGDAFSLVIDKAIYEGADTVPFASFGLRFLQGDKAAEFTEKSGVHAIVIGSSAKDSGVVALEKLDGKGLTYTQTEGLRYSGNKVKNNHIIVRVTASTDPWKSLASTQDVLERISVEGKAALAFSKGRGINTPYLKNIVLLQSKASSPTMVDVDTQDLESAVKELNLIRASYTIESE